MTLNKIAWLDFKIFELAMPAIEELSTEKIEDILYEADEKAKYYKYLYSLDETKFQEELQDLKIKELTKSNKSNYDLLSKRGNERFYAMEKRQLYQEHLVK